MFFDVFLAPVGQPTGSWNIKGNIVKVTDFLKGRFTQS
jgi:hypothetical protein